MARKRSLESPDDSDRAWKKIKLDFSEVIFVIAGKEKKEFSVHKHVVSRRSPFFAAACSEKWNRDTPIDLTAHESEIFAQYLQVLYQDSFTHMVSSSSRAHAEALINLYILADEIGDLWTANKTIDILIHLYDKINRVPGVRDLRKIYNHTPESSPFRRMCVDYFLFDLMDASILQDAAQMPHAFLADCVKRYACVRERCDEDSLVLDEFLVDRMPAGRDKGYYHQHDRAGHVYCCLAGDSHTGAEA